MKRQSRQWLWRDGRSNPNQTRETKIASRWRYLDWEDFFDAHYKALQGATKALQGATRHYKALQAQQWRNTTPTVGHDARIFFSHDCQAPIPQRLIDTGSFVAVILSLQHLILIPMLMVTFLYPYIFQTSFTHHSLSHPHHSTFRSHEDDRTIAAAAAAAATETMHLQSTIFRKILKIGWKKTLNRSTVV